LVPENCAHHLIDAFKYLETDIKCVIVGDASYADSYIEYIKESAKGDSRIIFTGYVFGKGYLELGSNALIFVETSGVGGTHPALTEAMGFGNCVVVNSTEENLETIGDAGFSYDGKLGAGSLRDILIKLLSSPEKINEYKDHARRRAKLFYSWDHVTNEYEKLFYKLLEK
jgi:glycosyltransferase involved in cell wall biosynthesis